MWNNISLPIAGMTVTLLTLAVNTPPVQAQENMDKMQMEKMMSSGPAASKEAAKFMTGKYGPPEAMSKNMMAWGKTGPWKRTIVYAQEFPHEFPAHHTDVMQQFIDYKAPAAMYDELAMYDGSVVLERRPEKCRRDVTRRRQLSCAQP